MFILFIQSLYGGKPTDRKEKTFRAVELNFSFCSTFTFLVRFKFAKEVEM